MAKGISWKMELKKDNTQEVLQQKDIAIELALNAIGLQAEKYAKLYLSGDSGHPKRVDTGNLRNSVTFHVAAHEEAVYVGTNVEYAPYVHDGTKRMSPNRFIRDAAKDHGSEYKKIAQDFMSK